MRGKEDGSLGVHVEEQRSVNLLFIYYGILEEHCSPIYSMWFCIEGAEFLGNEIIGSFYYGPFKEGCRVSMTRIRNGDLRKME